MKIGETFDKIIRVSDYLLIFLLFGVALYVFYQVPKLFDKGAPLEFVGIVFLMGLSAFMIGLMISLSQDLRQVRDEIKKLREYLKEMGPR